MPLDAARDAVIAAQARVIEVLTGQVADLSARVERLERLASFHAANTARAQGLPAVSDEAAVPLIRAFRHGVIFGLGQVKRVDGRKQRPGRDLLECLRHRQDDVLRFTTDLGIPPTSNQAARDVRPAKTQQKISGRLRSEQATRDRYAIRGYISTVAKHGAHVLTAIHNALAGNPWMPPSPNRHNRPPHSPRTSITLPGDVNVYGLSCSISSSISMSSGCVP